MTTMMDPIAFWDQRYREQAWVYGQQPNLFFQAVLDGLPFRGKLLLPGEGDGRQAIYAAKQGWEVDVFDWSEVACAKTKQAAAEAGVRVHVTCASALDFQPEGGYDFIASIFFHLPVDMRATVHQRMASWLKPGGMMLVEAFDQPQIHLQSGGPKDPTMLYSADLLVSDFQSLTTISVNQVETTIDEGIYHRGEAALVRYIGTKSFPFL